MSLNKLVFDATDADTIAASANVGAYLRSADGTLLTHTDVGGKKALDVRVAEGINVEVDLSHVDDSVKIGDGTDFLAINNDGSINAVVSATNLDIRDLAFATDKVDVSGSSVSISGTVAVTQSTSPWTVDGTVELGATSLAALESITVQNGAGASAVNIQDGGNSITVDAVNLDIRDLTAASDSVAAWLSDGSGNAISSTGGSLNVNMTNSLSVNDAALANVAMKANAETVGTSAAAVIDGADELASRKYVMFYNNGNRMAYIGPSGVTTSSGFPIPPGSILEARIGDAVDIYMIADAAGQNIRAIQFS